MYSNGTVAVDKGLGFDFSKIADLVKTALPVGLNIYTQQQQLKQVKAGITPTALPWAQYIPGYSPTFGQPVQPVSRGMSNTTMLLIGGGVLVGGLVLFKALK